MGSAAVEEKLVDGLKRHPLDPTQFDAELDLAERSEGLARVYGERVLQRPDSSADLIEELCLLLPLHGLAESLFFGADLQDGIMDR